MVGGCPGSPTPERLPFWTIPSPVLLQGGQGTQPLAQSGFLVGEVFFEQSKINAATPQGGGGTVNPGFPSVGQLQKQTWRGDCPLSVVPSSGEKALALVMLSLRCW